MRRDIPRLFAGITAKLEDLHGIAVDGQCADNARDMQRVLIAQLHNGLVMLDVTVRDMARALDGARR